MPRLQTPVRSKSKSSQRELTTSRRALKRDDRTGRAQMASAGAARTRKKFLRVFPGGFQDQDYIELERAYKWTAHLAWRSALDEATLRSLVGDGEFQEVARRASRIESRTNLLFSFEKMALRDAIKREAGAELFARALLRLLHDEAPLEQRFASWVDAIAGLPRKQTRVLTWPLATVFGFLADPKAHIFFKPTVTREAARRYGYELDYSSRPTWSTYRSLLGLAAAVRADLRDLRPRDMIDIQSFLWVQGSDEYPD